MKNKPDAPISHLAYAIIMIAAVIAMRVLLTILMH
jgi:hypothetical protein